MFASQRFLSFPTVLFFVQLSTSILLKEESDFRNERDVVPAGIRTGPNPQNYFFLFFGKVVPCNETPRSRVFRVFS